MARSKSISVKIATSKVIEALEKSLVEKKAYSDNYKKEMATYKRDLEKWETDVAKLLNTGIKPDHIRISRRFSWSPERGYEIIANYNVDFDAVAPQPEAPEHISEHTLKEQINEIENAIRILKMTDEEVVNTSTYNSIARFL
jgi:ABC-type Zn uptake system ZnuABC Zn-binding protein ZnuA